MLCHVPCTLTYTHPSNTQEFLPSGERVPLEANETSTNVLSFCRFRFDRDVLTREAEHVIQALQEEPKDPTSPEWVFVDEVGPIELHQHEGLWSALPLLAGARRNVLLVIRSHMESELRSLLQDMAPGVPVESFDLRRQGVEELIKVLRGD